MDLSKLSAEIDLEPTLDRLCGDTGLLIEIIDLFLEEFSAEQAHLSALAQAQEFQTLASKAHYFKGVSQNIGMVNFLRKIIELEAASKLQDTAACQQSIEGLAQIANHLRTLRQGMRAA